MERDISSAEEALGRNMRRGEDLNPILALAMLKIHRKAFE